MPAHWKNLCRMSRPTAASVVTEVRGGACSPPPQQPRCAGSGKVLRSENSNWNNAHLCERRPYERRWLQECCWVAGVERLEIRVDGVGVDQIFFIDADVQPLDYRSEGFSICGNRAGPQPSWDTHTRLDDVYVGQAGIACQRPSERRQR